MAEELRAPVGEFWVESDRLRDLLEIRGLTQAQVAARMGTSPQAIGKLFKKNSNPRRDTVERLAAILRVRPGDLNQRGRALDVIARDGADGEVEEVAPSTATRGVVRVPLAAVEYWGAVPARRGDLRYRGVQELPGRFVEGIERAIIVEVTDESAMPYAQRGEFLLTDTERPWTSGRFHVFGVDDVEIVRRVDVRQNLVHWEDRDGDHVRRIARPMNELRLIGVVVRHFHVGEMP